MFGAGLRGARGQHEKGPRRHRRQVPPRVRGERPGRVRSQRRHPGLAPDDDVRPGGPLSGLVGPRRGSAAGSVRVAGAERRGADARARAAGRRRDFADPAEGDVQRLRRHGGRRPGPARGRQGVGQPREVLHLHWNLRLLVHVRGDRHRRALGQHHVHPVRRPGGARRVRPALPVGAPRPRGAFQEDQGPGRRGDQGCERAVRSRLRPRAQCGSAPVETPARRLTVLSQDLRPRL